MKLPRRQFLRAAAGAAALSSLPRPALAQTYPTRPVHILVGFPAGGVGDTLARLLARWLSERLGQTFIVENRPGAATNIAADAVAHARPDGYTLLWVTAANAINATLYKNLNFEFIRDIEPVAGFVRGPGVMEINPKVPAKTLSEFIAYAKANPGKINMASSGVGSLSHVSGELFMIKTGTKMVHVPYRGAAPALNDLIAGQVQVMILPIISSIEYIKTGKLRALGVTTAHRLDVVPDIPTVGEVLPGFEVSDWTGLGAPKGTPIDIVQRLEKETSAALRDPKMKERLAKLGSELMPMSRADFSKLIADETDKWAKVVKAAGIKPQ